MTNFNPNSGRPFKSNNRQFTRPKSNSNYSKYHNRHGQYDHANQNRNDGFASASRPHARQDQQDFAPDFNYGEYGQQPNPEYVPDLARTHSQNNHLTQTIVSRAVAQALNTFDPLDDLNSSIDAHPHYKPRANKSDKSSTSDQSYWADQSESYQHHGHSTHRNANANASTSTGRPDAAPASAKAAAPSFEQQPRHAQQNHQAPAAPAPRAAVYHPWENSPQDRSEQAAAATLAAPAPDARKNNRQAKGHDHWDNGSKNKDSKESRATATQGKRNAATAATATTAAQRQSQPQQQSAPQSSRNNHAKNGTAPRTPQESREPREPREQRVEREPRNARNSSKAAFGTKQDKKPSNSKPLRKPSAIAKAVKQSYNPHVQEYDPRYLDYLTRSDSKNDSEPLVQTIISHQYQARESYHPQSHLRTQLISVHTAKGTVRAQPEKHIRRRPSNRRPYHP